MRKILSGLRKAIEEYHLIETGDKIAVGLSGGKDSLCLLSALCEYKKYIFSQFDLVAIAVDLTNGKNNYKNLKTFCKKMVLILKLCHQMFSK